MMIAPNFSFADPNQTVFEVVAGAIFVNRGQGFVAAPPKSIVEHGDKILLKPNSAALLMGDNGQCVASLRDAGVYIVPDMSSCVPSQATVLKSEVTISPANGTFGTAGLGLPVAEQTVENNASLLVGLSFAAGTAAISAYTIVKQSRPISTK